MLSDDPSPDVDLTACDQEPIHVPGAILPHGAMLVVDGATLEVLQAAGDTPRLIGYPIDALLGRSIASLLEPHQRTALLTLSASGELQKPRYLLDPSLRFLKEQPVDVSVHRTDDVLVIEIEAAAPGGGVIHDPLLAVQDLLDGLTHADSLQAVCQAAAERLRGLTGYDRVMVYEFLPDDSGRVIAESRMPEMSPFLGLHYPASDIPKQARALYLQNTLRLIAQVDYRPAPLVPAANPRTGRPLDMTFATLRDVSPVHRAYLRTMGVDASMSVSIIRNGRLWGLFACHHRTPLYLPREIRAACEMFGRVLSLQLDVREHEWREQARLIRREARHAMLVAYSAEEDCARLLEQLSPALLAYLPADGLAVRVAAVADPAIAAGKPALYGQTPTASQVVGLMEWLSSQIEDGGSGVFMTDRLGELWPPAREFTGAGAGVLAVSISQEPRNFMVWFRGEVVQTVNWSGDPNKPIVVSPDGASLGPRRSFELWKQSVSGRSAPWTAIDHDAAVDLRMMLLDLVLRRIDDAVRERQRILERDHELLLVAESDHRVKNTLAVIQALIVQSSRGAHSVPAFVDSLEQRIHAMAKTNQLLIHGKGEGVPVRRLLQQELEQYAQNSEAITLIGPDAALTPKAGQALALAIHELATNAAKYGALSVPDGRVTVCWTPSSAGGMDMVWSEAGGPTVASPQRRSFGSRLIERVLTLESGGRSVLKFPEAGVTCDISLPAASMTWTKGSMAAQGLSTDTTTCPRRGNGE